ncbi:MAG: FAD-binding oxidoreductase [Ilumatobacteraceae bacterium]
MSLSSSTFDVLVIGGGIAGVSAAYEIALRGRHVGLLEQESSLAYHTTGRSAATFLETIGGPTVQRLTVASRAFFESPPDWFTRPLLTPLQNLLLGPKGTGTEIEALAREVGELVPTVRLLDPKEACAIHPQLREDWLEVCMLEPDGMEIDVGALHQGYVAGLRANGGEVMLSARVDGLESAGAMWTAATPAGRFNAPVVVNAAGAWGDRVGALAGASAVGLSPLRRTVFMLGAPEGVKTAGLPITGDVGGTFYFKPEGPQFLCSPADENPSEPCDAQPEEIDIAKALDRIAEATHLDTQHVRAKWAGLRTFAPDRCPVVSGERELPGYFWVVGQGGFGIQTAPAMGRVAAALALGEALPTVLDDLGLTASDLERGRLERVVS